MMQLSLIDDAVAQRERILAHFEQNNPAYLTALRGIAADIATRNGTVTVDDLREQCEYLGFPLPNQIGKDERIFGVTFRDKRFIAVDSRLSVRAEKVARCGVNRSRVTVYRLVP